MFGLYNLGGGIDNAVSLRELSKKMEEITGKTAIIGESNEIPAPVPMDFITDISKIEHELGWKPTVSIDAGLQKLLH